MDVVREWSGVSPGSDPRSMLGIGFWCVQLVCVVERDWVEAVDVVGRVFEKAVFRSMF